MSRIEKYMQHTAELVEFDLGFATENIAGIDEVGRGPLAGDVYAACVVLPKEPRLTSVDASKKLSQKAREEIAKKIYDIAICSLVYIFAEIKDKGYQVEIKEEVHC